MRDPSLLGEWGVVLFAPVRLHEDGVDLFEVDGAGLVAHGLDEARDTEVASEAQETFGCLDDEIECGIGECGM